MRTIYADPHTRHADTALGEANTNAGCDVACMVSGRIYSERRTSTIKENKAMLDRSITDFELAEEKKKPKRRKATRSHPSLELSRLFDGATSARRSSHSEKQNKRKQCGSNT